MQARAMTKDRNYYCSSALVIIRRGCCQPWKISNIATKTSRAYARLCNTLVVIRLDQSCPFDPLFLHTCWGRIENGTVPRKTEDALAH